MTLAYAGNLWYEYGKSQMGGVVIGVVTIRFEPAGRQVEVAAGTLLSDAAQQAGTVRGYRSFMNLTEGRIFCVVDAEDAKAVKAWFGEMRMPTEEIVQVELEGDQGELKSL